MFAKASLLSPFSPAFNCEDSSASPSGRNGSRALKLRSRVGRSVVICRHKERFARLQVKRNGEALIPSDTTSHNRDFRLLADFFRHPSGRRALMNENGLHKLEVLDSNLFRCHLPPIAWLKFRVSPILDLRMDVDDSFCLLELLSCKFEGSQTVEDQNKRFSATMQNLVSWEIDPDGSQIVRAEVRVEVDLLVYTLPFTLLPLSAVESPGNKMIEATLDRLLPIFLEGLISSYTEWRREHPVDTDEEAKHSAATADVLQA